MWTEVEVAIVRNMLTIRRKEMGIFMDEKLRKDINRFNENREELDVFGLMDLADSIVPKLESLVDNLEATNKELKEEVMKLTVIVINLEQERLSELY